MGKTVIDYSCKNCGAEQCKLWRVSSTCDVELVCLECLKAKGHSVKLEETDQIYNRRIELWSYVPAVPTLLGNWWGYTSVPSWWVAWWKALPDSRLDCTLCCGKQMLDSSIPCPRCKGSGRR